MSAIQKPELGQIRNAASGAQHLNWSTIPIEHPAEGIERQMFVGEKLMICRFRFAPFLVTPEHSHPHEQMSLVVTGRVRFLSKVRSISLVLAMSCTFLRTVFTAPR